MLYELYLNKAVGKKGTSILLPFSKDIFYSTVEILITIKLYISFKVKKTSFLTVRSHFSVGDVKNIKKKMLMVSGLWYLQTMTLGLSHGPFLSYPGPNPYNFSILR